tara:strand:+ start:606 stop:803 length:198 start_codon:yes stop_codon:yes gene_type:complete
MKNYGKTITEWKPTDFEAIESTFQQEDMEKLCASLNRDSQRNRAWMHADRMSELRTEGHVRTKAL